MLIFWLLFPIESQYISISIFWGFSTKKLRRANDPWETRQTEAAGESLPRVLYISTTDKKIFFHWTTKKKKNSLKKKKKFFFDWQVGEEE